MRVREYAYIHRIKFLDKDDVIVLDLTFDTGPGDWYSRRVPAGREIIGLYCNTDQDSHYIKNLGFILWTPNLQGASM